MIANVIDNRKSRYRWKRINAIVEPAWHDNKCEDADQADPAQGELDYEERNKLPVSEAIQWADELPYLVTLYLNDNV
ncbi:MAG: hypothetical protein ACREE2_01215 [Stellaceae bacterium]